MIEARTPGDLASLEPAPETRTPPPVLWLLAIVIFVGVTNGTTVNVALPFIGEDFGASESIYGWVITGYGLTFAVFSAILGRLADSWGVRRVYVGGMVLTGLTGVLVALAPAISVVIGLRVLQGAASAALPALGSVVIARVTGAHHRGAAMGVLLAAIGVAAAIGPFLGGVMVEVFGWRSVFLLPAVLAALAPLAWRMLPEALDVSTPRPFDLLGAVVLTTAVAAVLVGLTSLQGGGRFGLVAGLLLGAGLLAFLVRHVRRAPSPLLPPHLFAIRAYVALCMVAVLSNAVRFGSIVLGSVMLVRVGGHAPFWVGMALLPGALAQASFSRAVGRWSDRVGARRPVAVGTLLLVVSALMLVWSADGDLLGTSIALGVGGLAFTFKQSPTVSGVSLVVPTADTGIAMGTYMMLLFLGGAVGVTVTMVFVDATASVTQAWLGPVEGIGAPFANAFVLLMATALLALGFLRNLPVRER